ncbi:glycosyltransferase [Methylomonas sp. HYX-M1]|uniref:glycosyltransferase n=1 Tax=Methylomonas sp. HYX-M1 TaxID=3139307 RepID=UPI00345B555A
MRILYVHNYYQQAGGEDSVFATELNLLSDHGHIVETFCVDNNLLKTNFAGKVQLALATHYSVNSRNLALAKINSFRPDLVHVHNFFPQISPSIYDACQLAGVPVVQTLHNYRLICPGALLMRDGKICEKCISGSPFQAALYRCYRGSILGSLVVGNMVAVHRRKKTWLSKVDRFIALTQFAKSKFVEAGFSDNKISVKPNFVTANNKDVNLDHRENFALFVGRLSSEKGLSTLVRAWESLGEKYPLKIIGSGPLNEIAVDRPGIEYLGQLPAEAVSMYMRRASFLVMPSEWYEGFPMVLVEAFANGLPVLCSRLGGMAEIVEDGVTGWHFESGNSQELADKVRWIFDNEQCCRQFGRNAYTTYLEKYTAEKNYQLLMSIYNDVLHT